LQNNFLEKARIQKSDILRSDPANPELFYNLIKSAHAAQMDMAGEREHPNLPARQRLPITNYFQNSIIFGSHETKSILVGQEA
jgi:hypothetical protein